MLFGRPSDSDTGVLSLGLTSSAPGLQFDIIKHVLDMLHREIMRCVNVGRKPTICRDRNSLNISSHGDGVSLNLITDHWERKLAHWKWVPELRHIQAARTRV